MIGKTLFFGVLFGVGAYAWDSTIHTIVAPTEPPIVSSEPWRCVTENATQHFLVPLPTGSLYEALDSYVDAVMEPCLKTIDPENMLYGCFPAKEKWCGFTSTVAPSLLPAWSSLGSAASTWWESHSAEAVSMAKKCPLRWYDASLRILGGSTLLNETIILAACYEEAHTTGKSLTASTGTLKSSTNTFDRILPKPTGNSNLKD